MPATAWEKEAVDALRAGMGRRGQRFRVGAAQLRELAPIEHPGRQVMPLRAQVLQDFGAGCIGPCLALLAARKAHLVEQDFAELLR